MDDAALSGLRLLVAGVAPDELEGVLRWLTGQGADPVPVGDAETAVLLAAAEPPAAVLASGELEAPLRARLDPLGLEAGPPLVALSELAGPEGALGALAGRRLRAIVERGVLRSRQRELEAVLAAQSVTRRREVEDAHVDALRRLLLAAEYRDDNTFEHTERVGHLAARMARHLGLEDRRVWLVRQAAPLHDIGKIAIPDSILLKPGRLAPEEYEVVKTHAVLGARVLADQGSDLFDVAEAIAHRHHERWDGDGYPDGLAGEAIPVEARLVAVADVFDVLVHERPYRESFTVEAAAEEIAAGAGTQFDPGVVQAFQALGPAAWREPPQPV